MSSISFALTLSAKPDESAPFLYSGPLDQGIHFARSLGYDCVELHISDPCDLPFSRIDTALLDTGLRVSALGTGRAYAEDRLSLTDPNPQRKKEAVSRIKSFIDAASHFHSLVIIGCVRGNLKSLSQEASALELLADSMKELDSYASSSQVTLVMEPINRYENNFLCSTQSVASFIQNTQLENVKLMADTFHMNIEDHDILQSFAAYHNDIYYIHFADSNRSYPGQGHIDFKKIVAILKDCNYNKTISAECQIFPDAKLIAKNWLTAVKELYKKNEC